MMDWHPRAQRIDADTGGTPFVATFDGLDVGWKVVLHTTEGGTPGQYTPDQLFHAAINSFRSDHYWPGFTANPWDDVYAQHYPLTIGSRALERTDAVPTNGARAIQVEITGHALEAPVWPPEVLDRLGRFLAPIFDELAIPRAAAGFVDSARGFGATALSRMDARRWVTFTGLCGHQHVYGNHHSDPGQIDAARILTATIPIPPVTEALAMGLACIADNAYPVDHPHWPGVFPVYVVVNDNALVGYHGATLAGGTTGGLVSPGDTIIDLSRDLGAAKPVGLELSPDRRHVVVIRSDGYTNAYAR